MMKEEIFEDLKKRHNLGLTMLKAMSMMEDIREIQAYDLRLVTIFAREEEEGPEHPLMEIRYKRNAEGKETIHFVLTTKEAIKEVENRDEDLLNTAGLIEVLTEEYVGEFPDCLLRWYWLGDDDDE